MKDGYFETHGELYQALLDGEILENNAGLYAKLVNGEQYALEENGKWVKGEYSFLNPSSWRVKEKKWSPSTLDNRDVVYSIGSGLRVKERRRHGGFFTFQDDIYVSGLICETKEQANNLARILKNTSIMHAFFREKGGLNTGVWTCDSDASGKLCIFQVTNQLKPTTPTTIKKVAREFCDLVNAGLVEGFVL